MRLNAMHGSGSSGTNVLCTIGGCLLCWASTGLDISKIATEIKIVLMLHLLPRGAEDITILRAIIRSDVPRQFGPKGRMQRLPWRRRIDTIGDAGKWLTRN